jgi:hypothetical protein
MQQHIARARLQCQDGAAGRAFGLQEFLEQHRALCDHSRPAPQLAAQQIGRVFANG